MSKPVILTGLRANNDLHIGNYFGALLPLIDMATKRADEFEVNLFVPDLHSFTTPIDHMQLHEQILHNVRLFVAAGLPLDHPNIHVYRQSYVPAHSELTWILDCFTGIGEMGRMTQFKDKSAKLSEDRISIGLFNYPVLMAADMLLYGASYVPVGDDQSQHLEFTRDIAGRMNAQFGELFVVPKPVKEQHAFFGKDQGLRIKDLVDPTKKMSKSDDTGKGVIFLGDDPKAAAKKILSATTDNVGVVNLDYDKQPGISNLLQIHALLSGETLEAVAKHHGGETSYGDLKKEIADQMEEFLTDFQTRLAKVDEATIQAKLEHDEASMRAVANKTLARVQRAVGLRSKRETASKARAGSLAKPAAIDLQDFAKNDIRMGQIISAQPVPGSDKLIRLEVKLGNDEQRTIITGMREFYAPKTFVGKTVPILVNLQPRTMQGVTSHGMLLAVEGQDGPVLLTPEHDVAPGSPIE